MKSLEIWAIIPCLLLASLSITAQELLPLTSKSDEARQLMRDSWRAQQDGYFKKAASLVEKALEIDENFPLALLYQSVSDSIGFAQKIEKIQSLQSTFTEGEQLFFSIPIHRMDKEKVVTAAKKLMEKYPKDYYLLTQVYYPLRGHDIELAKELLLTILKHNKDFPPAHNLLGYTYLDEKEFEKSFQHFDRYLKLSPNLPNAYDSNGDYYMEIENYQKAVEMYERAYSLDNNEFALSKEKAEKAKEKLKD